MRTYARTAGAAVILTTALLTSGCGGNDSGGDGKKPAGGDAADRQAGLENLRGAWSQGKPNDRDHLVLAFAQGGKAVLSGTPANCTGRVAAKADPVTLDLTCAEGEGYGKGTIEEFDGESLSVAWESGSTDTFTKVSDSPEDLEKELPDMPEIEG